MLETKQRLIDQGKVIAKFSLLCFGLILCFKSLIVEAFYVPSASMLPTLKVDDYLLVPKFAYGLHLPFMDETIFNWGKPNRGDVIIFTRLDDPHTGENESRQNFVKRVVGLPGEMVEVRESQVLIDGKELAEPYAAWRKGAGIYRATFGPIRVPDDEVFVLGDNRDESKDSRAWPEHFIDLARIKGRAILVYWSSRDPSRIGKLVR